MKHLHYYRAIDQQLKTKSSPSQNTESKDMNILTAIKTKPFILLAGISGTGNQD